MREDDGTGALTTKPLPGAQQIIAPDGKPIGTADQATADAMKAAAEKGTLTLGGDEQQTSEEQDGEEDLVRHGNHDVGGDGTDQFIHDIKMHDVDEEISSDDVAQAQAGFGGADPTSKEGVDNFLAQDNTVTPEEKEKEKNKKPPELGSADDFMLSQAVAFINGQPVKRSSSKLE